jgi:hypothetical protein
MYRCLAVVGLLATDDGGDMNLINGLCSNLALICANLSLDDCGSSSELVADDVRSTDERMSFDTRGFWKTYSTNGRHFFLRNRTHDENLFHLPLTIDPSA